MSDLSGRILSMRAFLVRGHPLQPREPALGYASRLAALNGVGLATLTSDMRIDLNDLARGDPSAIDSLASLRSLSATDAEALSRYTPRRKLDDRVGTVAGNGLLRDSFTSTSARVCPHCIREDLAAFEGPRDARPWMRLEWALRHVRVCRHHGNVLVQLTSGRAWEVLDFSRHVARMLPDLDQLGAEAVAGPGRDYCEWLVRRLDGIRDADNWLDDAPLHAAIAFCEWLGYAALHDHETSPTSLSTSGWATAAEEGYRTASRGTDALVALFDRMAEQRPSVSGMLAHDKAYGHLYRMLRRHGDDPGFEKFRAVLREHAFATMSFRPGRKFLGVAIEARRVHTWRTAAKSSSRSVNGMRRLMARGRSPKSGGSYPLKRGTTIPAVEVTALAASLADHLTATDVVARTGLDPRILDHLTERGYLPTLPVHERPAGTYYRYLRADVEALMSRLFRDAEPAPPTDRRMSLPEVHLRVRGTIVDLLALVLDGRLRWVGRLGDGDRYEHLMIDVEEVRALRQGRSERKGLFTAEVQERLRGLPAKSVNALAQLGFLTRSSEFCAGRMRSYRTITRESVEAFLADFVACGEIQAMTGVSAPQVARRLSAAGIAPAIERDRVRAIIYRRSEVAASRVFESWPAGGT